MSNFAYILNFLNKYAWNIHDPNNSNESAYGQIAYNAAKLFGLTVAQKIDGFEFVGTSRWQNSGKFAHYFWLQFKRTKNISSPFSISISNINIDGKYHFKVYVEIADKEFDKATVLTNETIPSLFL